MKDTYENPLITRYASREMARVFSDDNRFTTWRKLWIALAEGEKELGLNITDEQIAQMKAHVSDINYDVAACYGSCVCVRAAGPGSDADHTSRSYELLRNG